jgi:collagen type I/II/III/V/XI/XXIV/XXVII alpha
VLCVAGVLAASAGATLGQGSASDGPLRACVDGTTGALSVVSAGRRCARGDRAVSWNIRGRTGPRGSVGAQGESGAPGATGSAGLQGARGSFGFDDFDGMSCNAGSGPDTVTVTYDSDGFATFQC